MNRLVLHGTSIAFTETIREHGLVPPAGHGRGVRVRLEQAEARSDALAWAAYITARTEYRIEPKGIVVASVVPEEWLRDDHGTLRLTHGIEAGQLQIRGPLDFAPELTKPVKGMEHVGLREPTDAFFAAIEEWERLTANVGRVAIPVTRRRSSKRRLS